MHLVVPIEHHEPRAHAGRGAGPAGGRGTSPLGVSSWSLPARFTGSRGQAAGTSCMSTQRALAHGLSLIHI
eukprot:8341578-Alexandrium_andersonii.AAC.1